MLVIFVTSVIMVRGTNGKPSFGMVIGSLGNSSEFAWIERHDLMLEIT